MKTKIFTIIAALAITLTSCDDDDNKFEAPSGTMVYEVTFSGNWSKANHPTEYPSGAHFSKAIGMSHKMNASLYKVGELATDGIEDMAETGGTGTLSSEIDAMKVSGKVLSGFVGGNIGTGTGSTTFKIYVDKDHPYVSFVSMIAPSPDWFVGVMNVNLLNGDTFVNEVTVNAEIYDSGTDSGPTFTSPNADTNPAQPISVIKTAPLGDGMKVSPHLASFKFKFVEQMTQ